MFLGWFVRPIPRAAPRTACNMVFKAPQVPAFLINHNITLSAVLEAPAACCLFLLIVQILPPVLLSCQLFRWGGLFLRPDLLRIRRKYQRIIFHLAYKLA